MDALRQRFFDEYVSRHPEEATTLGLAAGSNRLRDHSPSALTEERRWLAEVKSALDAIDLEALSAEHRLDHLSMKRLVDSECHTHAWLYSTIDWSLYPYNMIEVQRLHAQTDEETKALLARLRELPHFLEQQASNVDSAIKDGLRLPDETLRSFFVQTQIPAAIVSLRELGHQGAAEAYEKHLHWMESLETTDTRSIGEDELRFRLQSMLGICEEPQILIDRAREDLALIHEQLIGAAAQVAPSRSIKTLADARALALDMQREKLTESDVRGFYRRYVERAEKLVREQKLFSIPDDYAMGIDILPPSFAAASAAGNWPAPLKAKHKLGHFLVAKDQNAHAVAWAADLAVHEGLPGHHLQSFLWQRRFGDHPAPVRFLVVHDHVAIPRNFWAPMLNIEGWAVYAEELMRKAGFFSKSEELFVLMAHAVRAARVIGDLSLAAGLMNQVQVQHLLMREALLTERHAWLEARRYAQIPLQASTYHLGRKAIEALAAQWTDLSAFHAYFLSFGPIDPRAIPPKT